MRGQSQTLSRLFVPVDTIWTYPTDVMSISVWLGPSCELCFLFLLLVEIPLCCCCHQRTITFVSDHACWSLWYGVVRYYFNWFIFVGGHLLPAPFVVESQLAYYFHPLSSLFHMNGSTDALLRPQGCLPYTPLGAHCRDVFHALPAMFVHV